MELTIGDTYESSYYGKELYVVSVSQTKVELMEVDTKDTFWCSLEVIQDYDSVYFY